MIDDFVLPLCERSSDVANRNIVVIMKVSVAAPAIDAKKHVRPASRSADMLSKPDDRSSVYYGSRCRQNPWISFLSGKIYIYYTRNMGFVKGEISLAAAGPKREGF